VKDCYLFFCHRIIGWRIGCRELVASEPWRTRKFSVCTGKFADTGCNPSCVCAICPRGIGYNLSPCPLGGLLRQTTILPSGARQRSRTVPLPKKRGTVPFASEPYQSRDIPARSPVTCPFPMIDSRWQKSVASIGIAGVIWTPVALDAGLSCINRKTSSYGAHLIGVKFGVSPGVKTLSPSV
jgi:hypothetical protein